MNRLYEMGELKGESSSILSPSMSSSPSCCCCTFFTAGRPMASSSRAVSLRSKYRSALLRMEGVLFSLNALAMPLLLLARR